MLLIMTLCLLLQAPAATDAAVPSLVTSQEMNRMLAEQKMALEQQRMVLDHQIKELDIKMRDADFALEQRVVKWDIILWSGLGLGGLSVIGLIVLWFKITKIIKKKMQEQIKESADDIFAFLDERKQDKTILANTRILLLNENDDFKVISLLYEWGFQKIEEQTIDAFEIDLKPNYYDLIIFNYIGAAKINEIMANLPQQYFIAYTKPGLNLDKQDRINIANSPITLFTRIMETEKYRQNLKK